MYKKKLEFLHRLLKVFCVCHTDSCSISVTELAEGEIWKGVQNGLCTKAHHVCAVSRLGGMSNLFCGRNFVSVKEEFLVRLF
jgi:hypothetical protein